MNCFVSCDWGSSRLRLRLVDVTARRVIAEHSSDRGIQRLAARRPVGLLRRQLLESELEQGLKALGVRTPGTPVVASGMLSSNLGWRALPYASVPAPIDGSTLFYEDVVLAGRRVRLISGLRDESDIMRGEETELVGIFAPESRARLADDCLVILPGSHSKHVRIHSAQIVGFTTYLTGELYALLSQHSTLATPTNAVFDESAFVAGLEASGSRGLAAALFQTRARSVLELLRAEHGGAFLSGVLIGAEISALVSATATRVVLAAGESLAEPYALACRRLLGSSALVCIPPEEAANATIAGHARIYSYL